MGRVDIHVIPRSSRNQVAGEREGAVLVRVTAPPVDGKANAAARKLVAKKLGVAAGRVTVVLGEASKRKTLEVEGMDEAELRQALAR